MTKQDLVEWKEHPITERVFQQIRFEISELREHLGKVAGKDSLQDRYLCGIVHGLDSLLNLEAEEEI
jgi:hypothetical protein